MTIWRVDDFEPALDPTAWVHDSAQVIGDVVLGPGVSVWPGAVLRGDYGRISLGSGSNVQDGSVLHTRGDEPTVVGADCVIGHLAHLESCVVEDLVLVGSTAVVLPGAVLRTGSMVAAGAVVTPGTEVPSGYRAQGVPARIVPAPLTLQDEIRTLVGRYLANALRYRDRCVEVARERSVSDDTSGGQPDHSSLRPMPLRRGSNT